MVALRVRALLYAAPLLALAPSAGADPGQCHTLTMDFVPAQSPNPPGMQFGVSMVAWVETASGTFVDTVLITRKAGSFGLGNRPGRFDFNSGPNWPYGRRITLFPVWAHRHGLEFPEIEFRNGEDSNLSHPFQESSREMLYCRPLLHDAKVPTDLAQWDAASCASQAFTDKGVLSPTKKSVYPPRADVVRATTDDASVEMYKMLNPFDAVSMASPPSGMPATVVATLPKSVPDGSYVLFVEVAREFDPNASYNETVYPSPNVSFGDYGEPYRGQPSVVYKLPFTVSATDATVTTTNYVGYGDPEGLDGTLRQPDTTITTGVPGSGAERLALTSDGGTTYRFRAASHVELDDTPPAAAGEVNVASTSQNGATITFTAPGDDGVVGRLTSYEIRYRANEVITEDNFAMSPAALASVPVTDAGQTVQFDLAGLLPETDYSVGIRAIDNCGNAGPLTVVEFSTTGRKSGQVDACFVATAAYGSVMANDVEMLRHFRDALLLHTALGELAVEAYYTFGPPVAGVVGESDLLRATARDILGPIVNRVRRLAF